jgi:hypothetical protein
VTELSGQYIESNDYEKYSAGKSLDVFDDGNSRWIEMYLPGGNCIR